MIIGFLRKWAVAFTAVVFILLTIAVFLSDFSTYTEKELEQKIHSYVDEIRTQSIASLKNNMRFLEEKLQTQAHIFNLMGEMTEAEIFAELELFAQSEDVTRATILTPEGLVYSSEFGLQKIDPSPYKAAFERTGSHIGKLRTYGATGQQYIEISTPVLIDGKKFGSLIISYDHLNFQRIFKVDFLEGDCVINLTTSEGVIIGRIGKKPPSGTYQDNYFDFFNREDIKLIDTSLSEFTEDYPVNQPNWIKFQREDELYCVSYEAVGISNWVIATAITDHTFEVSANSLEQMAAQLAIKIVIIMAIAVLLYVIYYLNKKKMLERLKDSYRLALKKSNDLFFEVDLEADTYVNHSEQKEKFFSGIAEPKFSGLVKRFSEMCPLEKRQDFLDHFSSIHLQRAAQEKRTLLPFEYMITTEDNIDHWFQSTIIPMLQDKHIFKKIICIEKDISAQKLKTEKLQNAARIDGLTTLCNKIATEDMVTSFLENEGREGYHALFMLDIDCFKSINDQFGHAKGDEVIAEVGKILKTIFRKDDILGRTGGDEFAAFLKDYTSIELVTAKARQINDELQKAFVAERETDNHFKVTASIGIALFKLDGDSFDKLYKNADAALYASKHAGKNQFTFFHEMKGDF